MDFGKLCLLKLYTAKLATASERIPIFFAVNGRILKWEMAPQLQEKIAITLHRRLGARLRQSAIQAGLDWLALLAWGSGDQAACAPAVKNLERLIGKFRIIDFPLSNCINSGIRRVGVVTQYKAHSLIKHLVRGWGHFKKELGEGIEILPASQRFSDNWYQGTADAVYQNIDIIRGEKPTNILILSGDHVYRQDYGDMLAAHAERHADMTVSCFVVPIEEAAGAFGVIQVDESYRIIGFEEKPANPKPLPNDPTKCLASMGNYIFRTNFLFDQLKTDSGNLQSDHDFGKNIIPSIIKDNKVFAYRFADPEKTKQAYWKDVGTLDSYWLANIELTTPTPALNLYDPRWPIWTFQEQLPPAKFVFNDEIGRAHV